MKKYFLRVSCKHQYSQAEAVADNHVSSSQCVNVTLCTVRLMLPASRIVSWKSTCHAHICFISDLQMAEKLM